MNTWHVHNIGDRTIDPTGISHSIMLAIIFTWIQNTLSVKIMYIFIFVENNEDKLKQLQRK
jgi:hypothetical protein